jgi:chitin disaccharide deacetylase
MKTAVTSGVVTELSTAPALGRELSIPTCDPAYGALIVNADDWGRDRQNTDRTVECINAGAVSSVSGMVFMEDSERAAAIACEQGIDTGLHLNLTTSFSGTTVPRLMAEHQQRLAHCLCRHRLAQVLFHPSLSGSFQYVVAAQLDEFHRIYGAEPDRIDGHHHMHLCANVLLGGLLPSGTIVRRNFSFRASEKNSANLIYRKIVDRMLARRHRLVDLFFSLAPLEPSERLKRIFAAARESVVELETHPVKPEENHFLAGGIIFRYLEGMLVASRFATATADRSPAKRDKQLLS